MMSLPMERLREIRSELSEIADRLSKLIASGAALSMRGDVEISGGYNVFDVDTYSDSDNEDGHERPENKDEHSETSLDHKPYMHIYGDLEEKHRRLLAAVGNTNLPL